MIHACSDRAALTASLPITQSGLVGIYIVTLQIVSAVREASRQPDPQGLLASTSAQLAALKLSMFRLPTLSCVEMTVSYLTIAVVRESSRPPKWRFARDPRTAVCAEKAAVKSILLSRVLL